MNEKRKKADWPIVVVVVSAVLILVLYVAGYFALSESGPLYVEGVGPVTVRGFDARWMSAIYLPISKIEGLLGGRTVIVETKGSAPSF